jgi:hypothetical protein
VNLSRVPSSTSLLSGYLLLFTFLSLITNAPLHDINEIQLSTQNRHTIDRKYFHSMMTSKIVVTINPPNWEGDFRLWEALSSGALVFVDHMAIPQQYPLVGGEHVVFFDNHNRSDLWAKLVHTRTHITSYNTYITFRSLSHSLTHTYTHTHTHTHTRTHTYTRYRTTTARTPRRRAAWR